MKKSLLILSQIVAGGGMLFAQQTPVSQAPLNRNVVLEELTGINCQYCPDGHKRANDLATANPGRVILVNIHAGGYANTTPDLRTADGNALNTFFAPTGYPAGAVQRKPFTGENILATGRGNWVSMATTNLSQASPVNLAMNAVIDAATRTATVTVQAYYTSPAQAATLNYLNVGFTQDNIEAPQVGMNYNPTQILANGKYNHNHVFRGFINNSGTWGDTISATQTGVITKTFTYQIPATMNSTDIILGDLHFFSLIHEGHNTYNNSAIITGAQVTPTFINVPGATVNLGGITNEFHVGCDANASVSPKVKVSNSGAAVTQISFETKINGGTAVPYNWTGNLPTFGTQEITIPAAQFAVGATNSVEVKVISVNNGAGTVGAVNSASKAITKAGTGSGVSLTIEVLTDNYPTETSWELLNSSNASIANGGPYTGSANGGGADALKVMSHNVNISSSDCFSFKLKDSYGDGLQYGTNAGGGFGFRIKQNGTVLFQDVRSSYDFGTARTVNGVVNFTLGINDGEEVLTVFNVYPNPAKDYAVIDFSTTNSSKIEYSLINSLGQVLESSDLGTIVGQKELQINTKELATGLYFVNLNINGVSTQKLLSVVK